MLTLSQIRWQMEMLQQLFRKLCKAYQALVPGSALAKTQHNYRMGKLKWKSQKMKMKNTFNLNHSRMTQKF